ncbi:hypothetical protein WA171_001187 [Blastocystis sp. BT1]
MMKGDQHYSCSLCHSSFSDTTHLRSHELSHSKVKPYVCSICSKRYSRPSSLREHALVHTQQDDSYICPLQSCGKHLQSYSGFVHHEMRHQYENMCDPIDIHREVSALLRRCTEKYHNEPECTRIACSYIRSAWRENIKRIAELRKEVKRLEMSLQSIDSDDETIEVIPEQYLTSTKPYKCGVPNCSESFSCYQDLEAHASSHPGISLFVVLNNQLYIPEEQRYHCPIATCEYGEGKKSISYEFLRNHFQIYHLFHTNCIVHQSVNISSKQYSSDLSYSNIQDDITLCPDTIYNNGNVILNSSHENQSITCK